MPEWFVRLDSVNESYVPFRKNYQVLIRFVYIGAKAKEKQNWHRFQMGSKGIQFNVHSEQPQRLKKKFASLSVKEP